ncbi:hypothetical protein I4U23_004198 [Adineta vaga]|nr:hypothetical protein I4U23_004198 [Adineta vaga]
MVENNCMLYGWFNYLQEYVGATNEELDYLKCFHDLKSKQEISRVTTDERYDGPSMIIDNFLYHGDFNHGRNVELLRKLNIQHIINVSNFKVKKEILMNFNVLWIDLHDTPLTDIREHFDQTNEFLNTCRSKNEKVLVHCQMGVSRSASIVLAYLLK